jgi:hypothetical protein
MITIKFHEHAPKVYLAAANRERGYFSVCANGADPSLAA